MMMRKVADSFYYSDVFAGENENRESYHSEKTQKEEKDSTQYLCNRLLLCLFALCLLWTTTLANCVYLVNFYFPVPQFSLVMDHCMSFISLIDANEHNYRDCVDRQVTTCELNLDIAYNKQKIRIAEHESNNLLFENRFTSIVSNCSSGYNQLQTVLQGWLEEGYNNTIPYKASCSTQQKDMISDLLNDQSSTNTAVQATSSNYISTTNARFSSLVLYSNELSTYNHNYLKNKTKDLHIQALSLTLDANINIQAYLKLQQIQIQQTFDMMIACLSLDGNASKSCPFPVNAASLYILESANVNALVTGMKRMVNLANVSVIEYRQQVTRAMTNMNNFYKSIASTTGIITWIIQNTPIPSSSYLCGRSSPNWCDFSPWDWYLLPLNVPTITFFPHMPDIDSLWQQIESISLEEQEILISQLQDLNLKIISSFDELHLKINSLNWDLLSDYDPPHYRDPITNTESSSFNLSDLLQEQYQLSKKYQNDLYHEIFQKNQTISYLNENNITASSIPSYLLALGNQLQSSLLSNVNMMWVSFRAGHVNYGLWLSSFFTIQGLLFLFDYIYRVIQSVKLINSFWRKGIVQLPVISLLDKSSSFSFFLCFTPSNDSGNQSKGNTNGGIMNNPTISWMITLLPYIWFQLLCLMVLIVLVALTISTILIPEYYSYIDACVNHKKSDTFLSANLAALAINYASYQGNKDLTIGINNYNKDVTVKCNEQSSSDSALLSALSQILSDASSSSNIESDSVSYVSYLKNLHDMNTSYVETMNQLKDLIDCVDLEKFSIDYFQYCQGSSSLYCLSNNDYTILPSSEFCDSKYLLYPVIFRSDQLNGRNDSNLIFYPEEDDVISDPLFQGYNQSTNLTEIVYANALLGQTRSTDFYCSQLPPCDVTCDGPDVIVLDNAAKDCSCMIEWYWNGMLLQLSFAVIIYIIINISRILINKGLIKIFWKQLTPAVFECHLYCDDKGKIISTLQHEKQLSSQTYTTNPQDPLKEEKMKMKNKTMIMKDIESKREDDNIIQTLSLFEETMKVEIAKKMTGFARIGWLLLFIAMVFNIIWIYYLLQLSNSLEYHPSYHSF